MSIGGPSKPVQGSNLTHRAVHRALALGFTTPFIAKLSEFGTQAAQNLSEFIENDHHATMDWIASTQARRGHPNALWPDAKSAIILGLNYGPETDPLTSLTQKSNATISVYARNKDYHNLIKGRLKDIAGLIARDHQADVKVFVDTAPLMEKPLSALAGLGWQGKHTNLVSRQYGSWLFLGTILTTADLIPTPREIDHCGTCRACLDICPTDAFTEAYKLDARKCISYLTIEHKGPVDIDLREKMGNRIYGCDDCLAICPWNKFAKTGQEAKLHAREDLNAPQLSQLLLLNDAQFRALFTGSPIKRIGRNRFLRNVLYAAGNSGDISLLDRVGAFTEDADPVLKDAALWARGKLMQVNLNLERE